MAKILARCRKRDSVKLIKDGKGLIKNNTPESLYVFWVNFKNSK